MADKWVFKTALLLSKNNRAEWLKTAQSCSSVLVFVGLFPAQRLWSAGATRQRCWESRQNRPGCRLIFANAPKQVQIATRLTSRPNWSVFSTFKDRPRGFTKRVKGDSRNDRERLSCACPWKSVLPPSELTLARQMGEVYFHLGIEWKKAPGTHKFKRRTWVSASHWQKAVFLQIWLLQQHAPQVVRERRCPF